MSQITIGFPHRLPYKIITILLLIAFVGAGGMKMTSPAELTTNFANWGYPSGFHFLVGIAEIAGGLGLLFPSYAKKAAILLVLIMVGAFGTHIIHPPLQAGIPSAVLGILSAVLAFRK